MCEIQPIKVWFPVNEFPNGGKSHVNVKGDTDIQTMAVTLLPIGLVFADVLAWLVVRTGNSVKWCLAVFLCYDNHYDFLTIVLGSDYLEKGSLSVAVGADCWGNGIPEASRAKFKGIWPTVGYGEGEGRAEGLPGSNGDNCSGSVSYRVCGEAGGC